MLPLPPELITSLKTAPGFNEETFVQVHASGEQVTSIRINPAKKINATVHFADAQKIPWCNTGFYLPQRPSFTADPLFAAGTYYVQEAGSMFLEEVVRQTCDISQPLCVLDLCAAPGGKSTLLQAIISANSLLVCNEIIKTRVNILAENITKWGAANVIITHNDAKDFKKLPAFFDLIVVDAPCSGSGLFRKDNLAIHEWSLNNVAQCSARQTRIIADVLPALKPGAVFIYSTCSYSEMEDENIADELVTIHHMQSLKINLPKGEGIIETISPKKKAYGYRFYPDKVKTEGFYIAAFKNSCSKEQYHKEKRNKDTGITGTAAEIVKPYLKNAEEYAFIEQQETIIAFPKQLFSFLLEIKKNLYIKKAGIAMGSVIRNELIPDHELAVSTIVADKIQRINADESLAMDYLRRKDIILPTDSKGWAMICFKDHALGLIKILPDRINNYYPKALRILNK